LIEDAKIEVASGARKRGFSKNQLANSRGRGTEERFYALSRLGEGYNIEGLTCSGSVGKEKKSGRQRGGWGRRWRSKRKTKSTLAEKDTVKS